MSGTRLSMALVALLLLGAPAATARSSVRVFAHDQLTAQQQLRGSMRFALPAGWREHAKSGRFTRRFEAAEASDCRASVVIAIRGKATRASARAQVRDAVGDATFAGGRREGGAFGIAALRDDASYGIAVVRVARRRFGHLRAFATYGGTGCTPERIRGGRTQQALRRVLRDSLAALRVARAG